MRTTKKVTRATVRGKVLAALKTGKMPDCHVLTVRVPHRPLPG